MGNWIVVVDDEPLSLKNAKELLSANGMRVGCLRSGIDLLKYMEKNEPDLILLDILMPEMDGFETYKALRQFEKEAGRAETPVIFLTGENNSEVENRGLRAGASDFIRKPFDKDILIRRINNIVANSKKIESLTEEATTDRLTGFLNKAAGTDKISGMCGIETGALILFDLDNFKLVNDIFGHDMGDRVLVAFADIVRNTIRQEDVVSRVGGDEFMGFFPGMTEEAAVKSLSERLNNELEKGAELLMGKDHGIPLGISTGVAFAPEFSDDYQILFRYADSALYKVKQNGKHGYAIYDTTIEPVTADKDLNAEMSRVIQILGERGDGEGKGALLLNKDAFVTNYRFMMRYLKRYKGFANRILFSLSSDKGGALFAEMMAEFGSVLQKNIRRSDIIFQSKSNQYFVVLPLLSERNTPKVIKRVMAAWEKTGYQDLVEIRYVMSTTAL